MKREIFFQTECVYCLLNLYHILTFIVLLNAPSRNRSKASYWMWRVCRFLPDSLFIRCCEFRFFFQISSRHCIYHTTSFYVCTYWRLMMRARKDRLLWRTIIAVLTTSVVVKYDTLCMSCTSVEEIITTTCGYSQ